jgi:hypothetical protein
MSVSVRNKTPSKSTSLLKVRAQTKSAVFYEKTEAFLLENPQWRTWSLSMAAWLMLLVDFFMKDDQQGSYTRQIINCGQAAAVLFSANGFHSLTYLIISILYSLQSSTFMVIAMMFPLLNEPVKHVAHSVKAKDRNKAVFCFLSGYSMVWMILGLSMLTVPHFFGWLDRNSSHWTAVIMRSSGFVLATVFVWLPSRPLKMVKCSQTMPIRIEGLPLVSDTLSYGCKMGKICLDICWPQMTAIVLYAHNIFLMYIVTIVLIYERYHLPHTSKIPGFIWAAVALMLFGTEMW